LRPTGAKGKRPAKAGESFRAAKTPLAFLCSDSIPDIDISFSPSFKLLKKMLDDNAVLDLFRYWNFCKR
jgi:hypothetical protein